MGYRQLQTNETTDGLRPIFDFEPLEPRLLFDAMQLVTFSPILAPVSPGTIISQIPIIPIVANGLNGSSPLSILNNRQLFSGIVAKFTDRHAANASAYIATINWGDGSPIRRGIVVSNPAGGFDVLGSHTYVFGQYNPTITITVPATNPWTAPRTLAISANLSVFPPPTACEAFPINAVDGQAFRTTLATYTGLDTTQLNRYSANIDWGDGQQSAGQLVLNSDGSVSVIGQHVYANPGFDDIQITVIANGAAADMVAATARCRATVANGLYGGNILGITAESGAPFSRNLAFFQFLGPVQDISNLRAEVIISGSNGAPTTIAGTILSGDNGFYVAANTIFTDESCQSVEVRIYDSTVPADPSLGTDQQLVGLAQGSISVVGHLQFTPQDVNMTAGTESRVLLGHLTSDDPGNLWNKSFDVQINWEDGSDPSQGEAVPNPAGGYDIYGTHTYPITGHASDYSFWVTITETRTSTDPAAPAGPFTYSTGGGTNNYTGSPTISVATGSFNGFYIHADSNGYACGQGLISAELYLGDDLSPNASGIIATVKWSDGVTTTAQITPDGGNEFSVFSSRTDMPVGAYSAVLSVSIGHYRQTASFTGYVEAYVAPIDYSLNANVQPVPVNAFVGDHFHGVIATFSVPGTPGQASDYTCYSYIPGTNNLTTSIVSNGDGSFSIVADFDATNPSSLYTWDCPSVTINQGSKYTSADLSVSITNDPTRVTLTPENNLDFRQREMFTTTVATFTAPSSTDTPTDFTATIDWGDGNTTSGVITEQYDGTFDISGTYGYVHTSGYLPLKITVTNSSGQSIATYSSIYLDPDPVEITPGTPTIQTGTVSGNLANFEDDDGESTDPTEYRVYHAALIDWGDGTVTSGLVTTNPDGTFSVASTHDYQADGDYQIHVMVRRNTFYVPGYYAIQPLQGGLFDEVTADAMNVGSTITADPDSDFGVTFYVHVVGTADRVAGNPANDPPDASASLPSETLPSTPASTASPTQANPVALPIIALFSSSSITLTNTHTASVALNSATTDTWLASNLPVLDSDQGNSDSPINSMLLAPTH